MPGQDGLCLAHAVQALPQPPAVVFVTAHADHAVSAFELDAVDYLTKPVRRERLQQALAKVQRPPPQHACPHLHPARRRDAAHPGPGPHRAHCAGRGAVFQGRAEVRDRAHRHPQLHHGWLAERAGVRAMASASCASTATPWWRAAPCARWKSTTTPTRAKAGPCACRADRAAVGVAPAGGGSARGAQEAGKGKASAACSAVRNRAPGGTADRAGARESIRGKGLEPATSARPPPTNPLPPARGSTILCAAIAAHAAPCPGKPNRSLSFQQGWRACVTSSSAVTHAPPVSQAHRGLGQAPAVQVLAKGAWSLQQGVCTQLRAPGGIVFLGIVVYGLFHTAMQPKVALRIPLQTLRRGAHPASHRPLVNAAAAAPCIGLHRPHAHSQQFAGRTLAIGPGHGAVP
jgi:hypothetical protein